MKKVRQSQQNTFVRIIATPYRALCRVRDFYVNSMIQCGNGSAGAMRGASAFHSDNLPRSFSTNSVRSEEKEDFRELVRAASARNSQFGIKPDFPIKKTPTVAVVLPPRSVSTGMGLAMGRIDEESCHLEEDNDSVGNKSMKYNRSKSHAIGRTPL